MDNYQKFIALSRYARHIDGENRRETWDESVSRYTDYMYKQAKSKGNYKIDPQPVLRSSIPSTTQWLASAL